MLTDLSKKIKTFRQIQQKLKRRKLESELSKIKTESHLEFRPKSQIAVVPLNKKIQKGRGRKPGPFSNNLRKLLPLASRIASFLKGPKEFLKLRLINHKLCDAVSNNYVWQGVLESIDRRLVREVNPNYMEVSLVKSIDLIDDYVRAGLRDFAKFNARAQALKLEKEYDRSIKYFLQPVLIARDLETLEQSNCIFKHFLPKVSRYSILKTIFNHYLDTAETYLALDNPSQSLSFANECMKYFNRLKELYNNSPDFCNNYASKEKKAKRIIRKCLRLLDRMFLIRYSTEEYTGLRVGSLLVATSEMGDDLFASSRVLITRFERNRVCEGVILNKEMVDATTGVMRIGGPCDMDQPVYLHDNPNVRGAVRVKDGLYFGGEIEDVFNNEGYIVKQYLGYCSWFPGQLEGELYNEDWVLRNDLSAIDILLGNLNSI